MVSGSMDASNERPLSKLHNYCIIEELCKNHHSGRERIGIHTHEPASLIQLYKWCLSYIKPYRRNFLLYLVLGLFSSSVAIFVAKAVQIFIDTILPNKALTEFFLMIGCIIILYLLSYAANARKNIVAQLFQQQASRDIQLHAFRKMRQLGFSYYEQHPVGETMSYFQADIPAVQQVYQTHLPRITESIVSLLISLLFLTTINYQLALIFIPCSIFYFISGPYFEKKGITYIHEFNTKMKEADSKQYVSLSSLLELRVYHAESWDLKRLSSLTKQAGKAMFMHLIYINLYAIMRRIAVYAGAVLLFYYGYHLVQNNGISVGEVVAFILMYFQVMFGITHLVTNLSRQNMQLRSSEKLFRFLQLKPQMTESEQPVQVGNISGDLHFKHVSFLYHYDRPVLQDFTLHVKAGERICLAGSSGSGKSTLTKLIGRFYDPAGGQIELDGIPIHQFTFEQLRNTVGYVFQETYLFGATIRENIRFGKPDATDEEIEAAAQAAYAHHFIMELPEGYDTMIGERGNKLSGGQRQRIAIARMFLKDPKIVVLDEATSALDHASEREVNDALIRLLEGRTTICVAHRESTIRQYDHIALMDKGRIVERGNFETLMNQKGLFFELMQGKEGLTVHA